MIVIKQTIEFTAGLFRGQKTERYIRCYSEKEKLQLLSERLVNPRIGWAYKVIKSEVMR